jgi:hemolysin activation/secretion protein
LNLKVILEYLGVSYPAKKSCLSVAVLSLILMGGNLRAQNSPDAGSLLRDIEKNQVPLIPKAIPKPEVKKESKAPSAEAKLLVKGFKFQDNQKVSSEDLQAIFSKYINQTLTVSELQNIAAEISLIYSDRGFVAQGQLPKQDVTDGVITIQILEAKFGGSVFDEEQKKLLKSVQPELIQKIIGERLIVGEAININDLDRALLIADDLPGVAVQGSLMAGEKEGETLVLIQAVDESSFYGDASVDNHGSRSTGNFKKNANLTFVSPFNFGDQFNLSVLNTQGTNYGRLAYSVPVGFNGLRLGVNASHMQYKVVTPESQSTQPKGSSDVVGIDAQYPLMRTKSQNLYLQTAYDLKYFKNEAIQTSIHEVTSHYRVNVLSMGLSGNQYDGFLGGGFLSGSLNFGVGAVDLSGSTVANQTGDAAGANTSGAYTRFRWNLSRQQNLIDDLSLSAALSGQKANKNLDSSEKFYLGGISGVRAYPNSEGAGSEGQMLNLELRQRLSENFTASAFYDWGRVQQYDNNAKADGTPNSTLNKYNLSGYGFALNWVGPRQLSLKAIWARRIGNNPYPTASGNDQDGSYKRDRYWLSANIPF